MRTSTTSFQQLTSSFEGSHTEVGDLDVLLFVEEEVLGFEISVTNVESVAVIYSRDDLLKVVKGFVGVQLAALDEVVEKLSAFDVFHDEVTGKEGGGEVRFDLSSVFR